MDSNKLLAYGKYISALISSVILDTPVPDAFDDIDWTELFRLADKHGVAVMIYPAVKKLELPDEARQLFEKNKNRMIARSTRQSIESERVSEELKKHSIKYIRLKGAHIKRLYPFDYLRTFGDVDLCVSESDKIKARPIMEALGYTLTNITDYHDEYEKNRFYIYELHSHILSPSSSYARIFDDPFSKSTAVGEDGYCYELNKEYLYLHLFLHLYKHFSTTGCGIRLFADLLVFESRITDADMDFVESVLKEQGLIDFYHTVKMLMGYFFFDRPVSDSLKSIAAYIFENETNGLYKYHVASLSFWGKVKYFLKNWFPPADELSFRYPVLKKAPILLPVCWLRRIFYSLFFNRSAFKVQVQSIKTASGEEYRHIKEIRKMAEQSEP